MVIAKNISVQMCFFTQKAFTNERGKSILEQLKCPCFEVPEHIYQKISDTQSPQGLMLILPIQNYNLDDLATINKSGLYLILDRLQDPGNIGTIIRTADAMGVKSHHLPKWNSRYLFPKSSAFCDGFFIQSPYNH